MSEWRDIYRKWDGIIKGFRAYIAPSSLEWHSIVVAVVKEFRLAPVLIRLPETVTHRRARNCFCQVALNKGFTVAEIGTFVRCSGRQVYRYARDAYQLDIHRVMHRLSTDLSTGETHGADDQLDQANDRDGIMRR